MGQGGRKRVDCYSLAVGNGMRCDQTHVPKTEGNVTHILLVVGGLMRLLGRKTITDILLVMPGVS